MFQDFRYVREVGNESDHVLVFRARVGSGSWKGPISCTIGGRHGRRVHGHGAAAVGGSGAGGRDGGPALGRRWSTARCRTRLALTKRDCFTPYSKKRDRRRLVVMRVAVCQLNSRDDRAANLRWRVSCWSAPPRPGPSSRCCRNTWTISGRRSGRPKPEATDGEFARFFAEAARELGIWVHAGSFHEAGPDAEHTYNTSLVFDPTGELTATYRKIHLYDVEIAGPGVLSGVADRRARVARPW